MGRLINGVDVDIRCGENGILCSGGVVVRLGFVSRTLALSDPGSGFNGSRSFAVIASMPMRDNDVTSSGTLSFLAIPVTCGSNAL